MSRVVKAERIGFTNVLVVGESITDTNCVVAGVLTVLTNTE